MATIAEKSRTKEIIDRLQHIINNASPVPLAAGKVTVYKDEVQSLLDELALQMENELKTYHEVNDRRGKIINEAKKEAEKIIYQAEHSASRMRVSKRSTNVAPLDYSTLNEEEVASLGNANEIYAASLIYTDEMLTEVSKVIEDAYHNIRSDYEIVMQALEEKMNTLISNKDELMMGLQEMDTADRSQQILEIGQLLSNELYNERMKQRIASEEYDDGSVQLTLDLQVEKAEESARAAEERAKQTAEALEQMTAERNALMETVMKMEQEQLLAKQAARQAAEAAKAADASVADTPKAANVSVADTPKADEQATVKGNAATEDEDVEYEIEYVTEDELEEGEEYEIEYVDDEEYDENVEYEIEYVTEDELEEGEEYEIEYVDDEEDIPHQADQKEVKEAIEELENLKKENEEMPVIPHFKSSEKIASAPSGQIAKMAKAVTTDKKYSGLIGRAVANREKAEAAVRVEDDDSIMAEGSVVSVEKNEKKTEMTGKPDVEKKTAGTEEWGEKIKTAGNEGQGEKIKTAGTEGQGEKTKTAGNEGQKGKTEADGKVGQKENEKEEVNGKEREEKTRNSRKKNRRRTEKKPAVNSEKQSAANQQKQDEDIKTDANGNQYVQATMQFDDDFEIMEF
ncbi:MAG: hypothetical protein PUC12_01530 [Clostridiales bacterium]|nr:hypothetical protein [Clostridiales bacterium]